jgi:DNA-binding transcriptional ArsR family regulator
MIADRRIFMHSVSNFVKVSALIGDPSRAAMLLSLMDGRALTASELANRARISPQTASSHLSKLVEGGLLALESHGRHRYYRLRNRQVAEALEGLLSLAPPQPVRSLRESDEMKALAYARTCYDHLAGVIGVKLTEQMLSAEWLKENSGEFQLTAIGEESLVKFGVDFSSMRRSRRAFARPCLDWTERRYHLAGALGAAIASRMFELQWLKRSPSNRSVHVTEEGRTGLSEVFGLII